MVTPLSAELLRLHGHYRNRLMPVTGGILDQPALFTRAVEVIEDQEARD